MKGKSIKGNLTEPQSNALYSYDISSKVNNLYKNIPKHIDGLFLFKQLSLMLSEDINEALQNEIKKRKLAKTRAS